MNEEIPIAEPMRTKRQCQQCGGWERCVYVKVKDQGFRRVCVPCAHKMRDKGYLAMPDRVWPMQTKEVFLAAWGRVNYGAGQFEDGWRSHSGFLTCAKWWCNIPSVEKLPQGLNEL